MQLPSDGHRIFCNSATALMLFTSTACAGLCQPPSSTNDVQGFFNGVCGDWIGTVNQYTDAQKADTKYIHAVIRQTGPDTCGVAITYYRVNQDTGLPTQIGATTMTNVVNADGTDTDTIVGDCDAAIDPRTIRHQTYNLFELLHLSSAGSLEGTGGGTIDVSGIEFDAGKNGKVSDYSSSWALDKGYLSIKEQFRITFRALIFSKRVNVSYDFEAQRGSDVYGLMKSAVGTETVR
jgi:hypothetical protein